MTLFRNFFYLSLSFCLIYLTAFDYPDTLDNIAEKSNVDYVNELYGIKLNQFKEVPFNEFGKPLGVGKHNDGFRYEYYLIKPDTSAYIVFEYSTIDPDILYSIQLNSKDESVSLGFKNVKFGMSRDEVMLRLGKPSRVIDNGKYGFLWEFENANYTLELNTDGKLSSVKIFDLYSKTYAEPSLKAIPASKDVVGILRSKKNDNIASILSPGLEIYQGKKLHFFKYGWQNEIDNDKSGVYALIKGLNKDLKGINFKNEMEFVENMRLTEGQNPKHVLKFIDHPTVEEIVMKWEFGRYLVWEIRLKNNCDCEMEEKESL